jgi:predicted HTH transcriptional regulator
VQLLAAELLRAIAAGEGKNLEFKRGLPGDAKLARTLCAFANTRGGLLLIGVGDRGDLVGAPRPRETMARLRGVARARLEPGLAVEVGAVLLDHARRGPRGRRIVWCSVPISSDRPHAAVDDQGEREIVARVGASNRRASGAMLSAIRAQRAAGASLDGLQRDVLRWVEARRAPATVAAFARERNVGLQRARRAFTRLELAGRLVAHGSGARREYALP